MKLDTINQSANKRMQSDAVLMRALLTSISGVK